MRTIEQIEENKKKCREWYLKNSAHAKARSAMWRKNNKERHIFLSRRWAEENPEKVMASRIKRRKQSKADSLRWRKENPEMYALSKLKNAIRQSLPDKSMTLEKYQKMNIEQSGKCFLCGKKPTKKRLCIDHCHKTGKLRRLLCQQCNHALGLFHDSINVMEKAIAYLRKYE